jgi:hypothetical protein
MQSLRVSQCAAGPRTLEAGLLGIIAFAEGVAST